MKQWIKKISGREEGFWSVYMLIFLVTIAGMGMGAMWLMRSEGVNTTNQVNALKADFAANGVAYYAIEQLSKGNLSESSAISVGNAQVAVDTSRVAGSGDILLTVLATVGRVRRGVEIQLQDPGRLVDMAIYTQGNVFNVAGKDSAGNLDPSLVVRNAPSIPTIFQDSLETLSTLQGHDQGSYTPPDGYPNGSFYYDAANDTANVTYVNGDFTVTGGTTVYGIFVVEGNCVLHGSSRVQGVIYLPNPTSTIITGGGNPSQSSVTGGIVSHGDITGMGNHISVRHDPTFMREFCNFQIGSDVLTLPVVTWTFI